MYVQDAPATACKSNSVDSETNGTVSLPSPSAAAENQAGFFRVRSLPQIGHRS